MTGNLQLSEVSKRYGKRLVVDRLDLEIEAGKFYTLLGPSGCGKTTTLRMIAGLERPDGGTIRLGERILSSGELFVDPERRDMGMVFQSYAVWPHMTVAGNVGFPLRLRGTPAREREVRIDEVLEMVGLTDFRDAPASALSGGQQQRVAIARALVYRPDVLLLDEPLSNLDSKLREQMRGDLRRIQRQLGTTAIMVTHDQLEAMSVSDQVVVMRDGGIQQIGTPESIYATPNSAFVMDFMGSVNSVSARILDSNGTLSLAGAGGTTICLPVAGTLGGMAPGDQVTLCLRLEDLIVVPAGDQRRDDWHGRIETATFLGQTVSYWIRVGEALLRADLSSATRLREGDSVYLRPAFNAARVWKVGGETLPDTAIGSLSSAAD